MEKAIRRYWPVFVLPTLIAFIIGFVWPFIWGAGLSFCKFTTVKNVQFVGLSNYAMIWSDNTFTHAFWFTAAFTVVSTLLVNVLAFAIALLLTRGMHGTNAFRTIFFLPNLIGGIVLGYIWQILLNGLLSSWGNALTVQQAARFCSKSKSRWSSQRDDLHLPDADELLQAVRPEPLADSR